MGNFSSAEFQRAASMNTLKNVHNTSAFDKKGDHQVTWLVSLLQNSKQKDSRHSKKPICMSTYILQQEQMCEKLYTICSMCWLLSVYFYILYNKRHTHAHTYVWIWRILPISGKHQPPPLKQNCNLIKRTWCNLDQMLIRSHISSPIRDPSIVIPRALCQARYVLPGCVTTSIEGQFSLSCRTI